MRTDEPFDPPRGAAPPLCCVPAAHCPNGATRANSKTLPRRPTPRPHVRRAPSHQVTHAVANIVRRVVILLASMAAFGTPMSPMGGAGSALALSGSLLYAMVKYEEKLQKSQV